MSRSLGIVIPAYDPDVDRLVEYVEALRSLEPASVRIEIDGASEDVRARLADVPATVNAVPERRGKGAAVTAGFETLDTDVYAFVDADGSTPVDSLRDVVEPVLDGAADLAVGSRRHPEASVHVSQSRTRERLGDCYAWLARRALPVSLHDYQCGAKAVDAEAWSLVRDDLYEPGFGWDVDLLAAAGRHGLTIDEVPIEWADRPGSTVDLRDSTGSLLGPIVRAQRRRLFGRTDERPLLERLAESE